MGGIMKGWAKTEGADGVGRGGQVREAGPACRCDPAGVSDPDALPDRSCIGSDSARYVAAGKPRCVPKERRRSKFQSTVGMINEVDVSRYFRQ